MNGHRPGPPYTAPRGFRWVPAAADNVEPVEIPTVPRDRKCQDRRSISLRKINQCNATAVALVDGTFLCGNHLRQSGCWVDAGVGMRWALEPTGEEE